MYHHDCGPIHPHSQVSPLCLIAILSCSHGDFTAIVELHEGRHEYKFFVDGQWLHDPNEVPLLWLSIYCKTYFVWNCRNVQIMVLVPITTWSLWPREILMSTLRQENWRLQREVCTHMYTHTHTHNKYQMTSPEKRAHPLTVVSYIWKSSILKKLLYQYCYPCSSSTCVSFCRWYQSSGFL